MKNLNKNIDTETTKVIFMYHKKNDDFFAVFPELNEGNNTYPCYSHIGQHSTAHVSYLNECIVNCSGEEQTNLSNELTQLGYNLEPTIIREYMNDYSPEKQNEFWEDIAQKAHIKN